MNSLKEELKQAIHAHAVKHSSVTQMFFATNIPKSWTDSARKRFEDNKDHIDQLIDKLIDQSKGKTMSESPGLTMEDFLGWKFQLFINKNKALNSAEINELIGIFEVDREAIEQRLEAFDEEKQSWRGFSQYVEDAISPETALAAAIFTATKQGNFDAT